MRLFLVMLVLLRVGEARADSCAGPQVLPRSAYNLPLGCPVVIAVSAGHPSFTPTITARRNNMQVDVTGSVTTNAITVTARVETLHPTGDVCVITGEAVDVPFDIYTINIANTSVGEVLSLPTGPVAIVHAAGACPPASPVDTSEAGCIVSREAQLDCTCELQPDAWECGGDPEPAPATSGCASASSNQLALGLGLVASAAACRRRRTRRR